MKADKVLTLRWTSKKHYELVEFVSDFVRKNRRGAKTEEAVECSRCLCCKSLWVEKDLWEEIDDYFKKRIVERNGIQFCESVRLGRNIRPEFEVNVISAIEEYLKSEDRQK